jgi:hypothetical protein
MRVVEGARDGELEDAVSEELEALVRKRAIRRPRRVREDSVAATRREIVDQPSKRARASLLPAAIGAR